MTLINQKPRPLKICPWCGEVPTELTLSEGNTYRWAIVTPNCCGDVHGEIRRMQYPAALGHEEDVIRAEAWWNTRKTELVKPR